jgi:molecular chaperone GrpE
MTMPDEPVSLQQSETAPGADAGAANGSSPALDAAEVQKERDEYRDLLLRTRAEFDNYRKRVERERLELTETAAFDLLGNLLPVVDDLERALSAPADASSAEAYRRGVELIHRQLLELLRQHGVKPIEALGTDFDPRRHQAVSHEATPGRREGEVIEEYRRGYLLGNRLLRPSMVKVAASE